MKKLLAVLLTVLMLLSMPLPVARAEDGSADVPAPEANAEPTQPADPTAAPASDESAPPAAVETEAPDPTPVPPAQEEPDPTEAPAPTEAPDPMGTPDPAEEPDPVEEPDPTEEPPEAPHNQPRRIKSLKYWEKERQNIRLRGDLREDILIIARSQLGYSADSTCYEVTEAGRKRYYTRYGDWYGTKYCDWCDVFVSFCIHYAGNDSYPKESSCARHMMNLKRTGYWREWNSYVPEKGDIVFFVFNKENSMPTHVGLVEEVIPAEDGKPGQLITIEGNQRNPNGKTACVRRMVRDLNCVVGYGTYEQGRTYPEEDTVRSNGWTIIDADSRFFVEYPTEEALRFLGLENSRYYEYWFPAKPKEPSMTEPVTTDTDALPAEPAAEAEPKPEKKPKPASRPAAITPEEERPLPKLPRLAKGDPGTGRDSE